jgi:hypothetical protein
MNLYQILICVLEFAAGGADAAGGGAEPDGADDACAGLEWRR